MLSERQQKMVDLLDKHVGAEVEGDLETTMVTMTEEPHLHNVAVNTGGYGKSGVRDFYRNHLVGKFFPPDMEMERVSLTVDDKQVVDEVIIRFTHTMEMDWRLPLVPPTGKRVEAAFCVVVGFEGEKIAHEHIYWDQASVLVQIGLLDPTGLPVTDVSSARRVLDPSLPARRL